MSWAVGYDTTWKRDIGYGVPGTCDHPGCGAAIDRGLGYVCGGDAYGGRHGCGIFFCAAHRHIGGAARAHAPLCTRCYWGRTPYAPTPDTLAWVRWKATDASWQRWRDENPKQAMVLHARIAVEGGRPTRCELCPAIELNGEQHAVAAGWVFSWDGWLCPNHKTDCNDEPTEASNP